jgi:hypothetical protein
MCITDKARISHDVLAYLVHHRDAQDTLEGVVEWWLTEQKIVNQTAVVSEALGELVAEGLVLEREGRDRAKRYRLNRRRTKEIMERLRRAPEV